MAITLDGTSGLIVSGNTNTLAGVTVGLGAGAVWVTDSFHLAHEALTNAIIFDLPCALSDTLGVLGLRLSG